MLAVGRLGCFANGCCTGLPTDSPFGVRFPARPGLTVWPSQLFESTAALLIGAALIAIEWYRLRRGSSSDRAIIFPVFLISYGAYRFVFDFLRARGGIFGLGTGQLCGLVAVIAGICWLAKSLVRGRVARAS
jgi:phosphatidylglycerol:prolipoprotein diacylglycerol transferase